MTTVSSSWPPATALPASVPTPEWRRVGLDVGLLLVMNMSLAWSLQAAGWSEGLERLPVVAFGATVAAAAVACSGFRRRFALLYNPVVGAAVVLFNMARLAPAGLEGQERVYHIIQRAWIWLGNAVTGQPTVDNLMFVFVLTILIWVLAFSAGWAYLRDNRRWLTVLPTGMAMLVNLYYAPSHLGAFLVVYVIGAILLVVRATLAEREQEWQQARVYFPRDIHFDFMRDGLLFALFVILIAWVLPSSSREGRLSTWLEPLQRPWQEFQQEWTRLFSTLNYGRARGGSSFGTSLALTGPRVVSDEPVADIKIPVNRYYRAVVLDTYLSSGWILQDAPGARLSDELKLAAWANRVVITQTVTTYQGGNLLLAAPTPIRTGLAADARVLPEGVGAEAPVELAMVVARRPLDPGESYVIVSAVPDVTIEELRAAGTGYPDFIRERYLQLPDGIPARVFELAESLVVGLDNPYDIARQIELYLRTYTYNDQIPGPRPGQDAVDYFLFEEKQGYCNYYASAMAVMLRYLGIPARLGTGFATGELIPQTGAYRLRERDAHTWVEVYFPGYGWIEFEPTASEPLLTRPSGEAEGVARAPAIPPSFDDETLLEPGRTPLTQEGAGGDTTGPALTVPALPWPRLLGTGLLIGSLAGILTLLGLGLRRLRQPLPTQAPVVTEVSPGLMPRLWQQVLRWARRFGLVLSPSQTALEQAFALGKAVPAIAAEAELLAGLYTRDRFSSHPLTPGEAGQAQLAWLRLRLVCRRYWLERHLRLPPGLKRALFREANSG